MTLPVIAQYSLAKGLFSSLWPFAFLRFAFAFSLRQGKTQHSFAHSWSPSFAATNLTQRTEPPFRFPIQPSKWGILVAIHSKNISKEWEAHQAGDFLPSCGKFPTALSPCKNLCETGLQPPCLLVAPWCLLSQGAKGHEAISGTVQPRAASMLGIHPEMSSGAGQFPGCQWMKQLSLLMGPAFPLWRGTILSGVGNRSTTQAHISFSPKGKGKLATYSWLLVIAMKAKDSCTFCRKIWLFGSHSFFDQQPDEGPQLTWGHTKP